LSNHAFAIKNIIVMRLDVSSLNTIEVVKNMGCFGGYGYGGAGYGMPSYGGAGFNFALIVVLFILLIIVLAAVV
jgi:uncharacterized protein (TIGR01732 family)